jgi:hypothetical protein
MVRSPQAVFAVRLMNGPSSPPLLGVLMKQALNGDHRSSSDGTRRNFESAMTWVSSMVG